MKDQPPRRVIRALRTLADELEALPDAHPRTEAIEHCLHHCEGGEFKAIGAGGGVLERTWGVDSDAWLVEGAIRFEGAFRLRHSATDGGRYKIRMVFPGDRMWCEATHDSMAELYAQVSTLQDAGQVLTLLPSSTVVGPADEESPWHLYLEWVDVPANGAWLCAEWAMYVLERADSFLEHHPALGVMVVPDSGTFEGDMGPLGDG